MFVASGCSSVARNGEGGAPRADGGRRGGGVNSPRGDNSGGSTVEGTSTSKNRPSHHKYKSPKQFELKQSWKALRALNARWALPVYPVNKKPLARKRTLVQKKGLEWNMNGLGKPFNNKNQSKKSKTSLKNQSKIAAREQTTSETANFCSNTVFSLFFQIRVKKFHAPKSLAFSLHFLFPVTKITTPIWFQKSWKCVNRS